MNQDQIDAKNKLKKIFSTYAATRVIRETLIQKLIQEEPTFTGQVDFTVHCRDGGIGSIDAFSKRKIKNGNDYKNI